MNFRDDARILQQLSPFTRTRSIADIRVGILTIREKWELLAGSENLSIPSHLIPTPAAVIAVRKGEPLPADTVMIEYPWHIFQINDFAIRNDFLLLTQGRTSRPIPASNRVTAPENIFLEAGARVEDAILNASGGPIYLGQNAEVLEGCMIRGPFALCESGLLKMGTKVYGATTVGPFSIAGGEIKNSVIFGYSNKAHDGYLGDSVIGEWCNLGAGTSNSNLKNNAGEILINTPGGRLAGAGIKCGLLMGDYTRCAINTSFNTGTVAGVCCNIFGQGLTPKYIPDFTWGFSGDVRYEFEKALRDISNWKKLKNSSLSDQEISTLKNIFDNH